jgi:hypothetical protein
MRTTSPLSELAASAEWKILLECASGRPDAACLGELLPKADGDFLLELAEEHGVIGIVAARLGEFNQINVPAMFRRKLLERQKSHALSALGLIAEMLRVLNRFSEAGIQALVLKGPALSLQAYGDATARQYGDVDLLLRQKDIYRAAEVMMQAGFDADVPLAAVAAGKIPGEYLFSRPNTKVIVELHTEKTLRYFPNRLAMERLFEQQTTLDFSGHVVPTLSNEDALVAICTHGAKHCWERLMWIADVSAMLRRQTGMDWVAVERTAEGLGAQRIVYTGLLLARELLHAPVPAAVEEMARADRRACKLAGRIKMWLPAAGEASPRLLRRAIFRAQMRGGFFHGLGYLTRLLFSPTEEDWKKGHEHRSSPLLELARRLVRLAGKYGRDPN